MMTVIHASYRVHSIEGQPGCGLGVKVLTSQTPDSGSYHLQDFHGVELFGVCVCVCV